MLIIFAVKCTLQKLQPEKKRAGVSDGRRLSPTAPDFSTLKRVTFTGYIQNLSLVDSNHI
jgi:hypothetical protein